MNALRSVSAKAILATWLLAGAIGCGQAQKAEAEREEAAAALADAQAQEEAATKNAPVPIVEVLESELGWAQMKYTYNGEPFTGRAVKRRDDGTIKQQFDVADGVQNGVAEEWYDNGKKKVETRFKAGKRHGDSMYWYEDGRVMKKQLWEDDVLVKNEEH